MKTKNINVYELTSDMAVEYDIGNILNKQILEGLKHYDKIIVDFSNVNVVLTAFLNAAIGQLFVSIDKSEYENKIELINLPALSINTLNKIIKGAEKKFVKNN